MAKTTIMGASGNTEISLQSKFVFTFKTIITVFITIGSMLWTYHTFVLDKQFEHLEEDMDKVELKIDKVYDHMIGIGGANDDVESAEEQVEKENEGSL